MAHQTYLGVSTTRGRLSRRSAPAIPSCVKHQQLFGTDTAPIDTSRTNLRRRIVYGILSTHATRLPENLDQLSRPYQITSILDRLSVLHASGNGANRPYNFYLDSNVPELHKSSEVLGRMTARLDVLIKEWPDQMVLQHLKARCDAVLKLDVLSSVAKVLSAIEQLLLQMEDWEMYANKENTLRAYQQDLVTLVVAWRLVVVAAAAAVLALC